MGINHPGSSVCIEANGDDNATLLSTVLVLWRPDAQDDIATPAVVCYLHHPYYYHPL